MVRTWAPGYADHPPFTLLLGREDFVAYREKHAGAFEEHRTLERKLAQRGETSFSISGYCAVCEQTVELAVDYLHAYPVDGVLTPNWRERLVCPLCHFNNRARATIHLM